MKTMQEVFENLKIVKLENFEELCKNRMCTGADFDAKIPHIKLMRKDDHDDEIAVEIPQIIAKYLRTHHCGSYQMREIIRLQAKAEVQNEIKDALGIKR